jgi:hypothetical protein
MNSLRQDKTRLFNLTLLITLMGCQSTQELNPFGFRKLNSDSQLYSDEPRVQLDHSKSIAINPITDERENAKPTFELVQSDQEFQSIYDSLKDVETLSLTILFKDAERVRLRRNKKTGTAALENKGVEKITKILEKNLDELTILGESSQLDDEELTEQSCDTTEQKLEQKIGVDIPNKASFITVHFAKPDFKVLLKTIRRLEKLRVVRSVNMTPPMTGSGIDYKKLPVDPAHPDLDWYNRDLDNILTHTNPDGQSIKLDTHQWNRHGFSKIHQTLQASGTSVAGSSNIKIAIIDQSFNTKYNPNGINYFMSDARHYYTHPTSGNISFVYDVDPKQYFLSKPRNSALDTSEKHHGTAVASVISGLGGNIKAGMGVAPGCKIVPLSAEPEIIGKALPLMINHCIQRGVHVISMSMRRLGSQNQWQNPEQFIEDIPEVKTALLDAYNNGITFVYAAGNENREVPYNSAHYTKAICVGAVTDSRNNPQPFCEQTNISVPLSNRTILPAFYSNYGSRVDIAAIDGFTTYSNCPAYESTDPRILQTYNPNFTTNAYYAHQTTGTSYTAPLVAATAALVQEQLRKTVYADKSEYARRTRQILLNTVDMLMSKGPNNGLCIDKPMCAGYAGFKSDGTQNDPKKFIRSLNAYAAWQIARSYNSLTPVQIYRSTSYNRGLIDHSQYGSRTFGYPDNAYESYPYTGSITVADRREDGGERISSVTTVFSYGSLHSFIVNGSTYLRAPNGTPLNGSIAAGTLVRPINDAANSLLLGTWTNQNVFNFN